MSDAKAIRKQVRNVMQEVLPEVMQSVVGEAVRKEITEILNKRLDGINEYCRDQLLKQDKRAKDVQGFLMREVRLNIRNSLADMDVTIEAVVQVLADSGVVVENFVQKVNEVKPQIVKRREEEAKAKMEAELKAQQDAQANKGEASDSVPNDQPSQA